MTRRTPASTLVLLVRHGLTPTTGRILPGRTPGLHLSPDGVRQAQAVAERLTGLTIDAVRSSPLERAKETAAATVARVGIEAADDPRLTECDFGEWTGRKLTKLMRLSEWTAVQRAPSTFRFPSGESFPEMQARMVAAIDAVRTAHVGGVVVCFSHADPIKAALAHALGTHLDLFQRIVVSPGSVSAVAYPPGGAPVVLTVNSTHGPLTELRAS